MKLYGDPRQPARTLLCQTELADALKKDPTLADTFDRLLTSKTLMFIGSSLDGLLTDLKSLPIKKTWTHKHYAFVAVGGGNWEKQVQTLDREYGICCVVCGEEVIATSLVEFLEKLVASVSAIRTERKRPSGGAQIAASVRRASAGAD
jgi:hypothetical protein